MDWQPRYEWDKLVLETLLLEQEEALEVVEDLPKKKIESWEELRGLIDLITGESEAYETVEKMGELAGKAVKNVMYFVPGIGNAWTLIGTAKDAVGFLGNLLKLPEDRVEDDPLLSTLQLSQEYIDIVDDAKAKEFLKFFGDYIKSQSGPIPPSIPLNADWNGDGSETTEDVPTTINSLFQKWLQDTGEGDATVVGAGGGNSFTDIDFPDREKGIEQAKSMTKTAAKGIGKTLKSFLLNVV